MLLRRVPVLTFLVAFCFLAPSLLHATPPQEEQEPQIQQPAETEAETPAEAEPAKEALTDRLKVHVGAAYFVLRGNTRGVTDYFDIVGPYSLQQTLAIGFKSATGTALKADASYMIQPRWSVRAELLSSSPGSAEVKDQRLINESEFAGDFRYAEFSSEHEPTYFEWSLGGAFKAFPGKKREGSRLTIEAIMDYRKAHTEYLFDPGDLVVNPFDPNAFAPSALDPFLQHPPASYNNSFETLAAGVRVGGPLSSRFTLSGVFEWIWFARFEGNANLGPRGTVFVHSPFGHFDPIIHTYFCNNDPDPNSPRCQGLLDADLRTARATVSQKSNRARGLRLDLDLDVKLTDWFGVAVGYHRQDYRTVGGSEKRSYGNGVVETGELIKASIVTQAFVISGRFLLF